MGREGQDHAAAHRMERDKDQSRGLRLSLFYLDVPLLLDEADEAVSGGIVGGHGGAALQLGLDLLGQLLPQLHSAREGWERRVSRVPEPAGRQTDLPQQLTPTGRSC